MQLFVVITMKLSAFLPLLPSDAQYVYWVGHLRTECPARRVKITKNAEFSQAESHIVGKDTK